MASSVTIIEPTEAETITTSFVPTLRITMSTTLPFDGDTVYSIDWEIRRSSDNALIQTGNRGGLITDFAPNLAMNGVAALADDITYKWRVLGTSFFEDVSTATNETVAATAYRTFTISANAAPTAAISSPTTGGTPGTLTPTLVATFSDPDTGTNGEFSAYQMQVRRVSDAVSFWDTGQLATTVGEKTAKQVSKTYAGTTLVNGTAYEWRVRVQDGAGEWSGYTAYQSFTPSLAPNAPTGITPSGLQNTLTPTVSGTYSQGSGGTETDFQYEIRQNAVTIYQSGDVAADIATGQAFGTNNPSDVPSTPPTLAWGTSYQIRARSKDNLGVYSDWTAYQAFSTNSAPTTATNLSPANGAVTGDTTPTLSWTHNDPDGDAQTAVEIELYDLTAAAFVTGYDPKALTQATTTHDVTETLTQPNDHQWRIRTKGTAGPGFGPWSDWATFTDAVGPTVVLDEPDPDDVIATSAFTVDWTTSGGSGTQQDYRIRIYASNQSTVVYDSGVIAGTDQTANVLAGNVFNGNTYYALVTVRDTLSQTASTALVRFTTSFAGPDVITGLTLTMIGDQA